MQMYVKVCKIIKNKKNKQKKLSMQPMWKSQPNNAKNMLKDANVWKVCKSIQEKFMQGTQKYDKTYLYKYAKVCK